MYLVGHEQVLCPGCRQNPQNRACFNGGGCSMSVGVGK